MSLSFDRDTLERSLELLSQEMGVNVVILGADLQREGITKNQSFAIDERNQPAVSVLWNILRRASRDGKLAYVVRSAESGGGTIFITTRAAARDRGETVVEESGPKTPKESR